MSKTTPKKKRGGHIKKNPTRNRGWSPLTAKKKQARLRKAMFLIEKKGFGLRTASREVGVPFGTMSKVKNGKLQITRVGHGGKKTSKTTPKKREVGM